MKNLKVVFVLVSILALTTGAVWAEDYPYANGSFESVDSSNAPTGWTIAATGASVTSLADRHAVEGGRLLRMNCSSAYGYVWSTAGDYRVKANSTYTLYIYAAKIPGFTNPGGKLRLYADPTRTGFGTGSYFEVNIPQQTVDWQWNSYQVSFNSASYPSLVGYFLHGFAYSNSGGYMAFDMMTLDGPATGSWGIDIPFDNQSFESVDGYSKPVGWTIAATNAVTTSISDSHAYNGSRVLQVNSTSDYGYLFATLGDHTVQDDTVYTLSIYAAKMTGHTNPGGLLRLYVDPTKDGFGTGSYFEVTIPQQTVDWQWNKYTVTFNSASYPSLVGYYFHGMAFVNSGGGSDRYMAYDMMTLSGPPSALRASDAGKQWVRGHDLTNAGMIYSLNYWNVTDYKNGHYKSALPWNISYPKTQQMINFFDSLEENWLTFHDYLNTTNLGSAQSLVDDISTASMDNGWYLNDEPVEADFAAIGQISDWVKENRPNSLVQQNVNVFNSAYLDSLMTTIKPDVLMFDQYPFNLNGSNITTMFSDLMTIRGKAATYGAPFFAWSQAFSNTSYRLPSESDVRMQTFSNLTAGAKGVAYFLYNRDGSSLGFTGSIVDNGGVLTSLYYSVLSMNAEINNLGPVLRHLSSGDVRFIPGETDGTPPSPPSGLSNWSSGAGGDSHIQSVALGASQEGDGRDGLIGFFTDDNSQQYFMLTNLYHGAGLSASATSLRYLVTFDANTNGLWRVNRSSDPRGGETPTPNGSFEHYSNVGGNPYYPDNWAIANTGATIQSVADSNAFNTNRVLRATTTSYYGYAYQDVGPYQIQSNSVYILSACAAKSAGQTNNGGFIRLYASSTRGSLDGGTYFQKDIPVLTVDGDWNKYLVAFNSADYPSLVGKYLVAMVYSNSGGVTNFDDVVVDYPSPSAQQWVALSNNVLDTTLTGGTGDLYTYGTSSVPGFDVIAPRGIVSINNGAATTTSTSVTLYMVTTDDKGVIKVRFSNDKLTWSDWVTYSPIMQGVLPSGAGTKTVYAQFQDALGNISPVCWDSIALQ